MPLFEFGANQWIDGTINFFYWRQLSLNQTFTQSAGIFQSYAFALNELTDRLFQSSRCPTSPILQIYAVY